MHIESFTNLPVELIYITTFLVVLVEAGVAPFFFFPGDSLLFTLGVFCASGKLSIFYLVPILIFGAIFGNMLGYYIGNFLGSHLKDSRYSKYIKQDHIERARKFYDKFGQRTVFFARFVPVIRTAVPLMAGMTKMNKKNFLLFSILGAVIWVSSVVSIGYFFGNRVGVDQVEMWGIALIISMMISAPIFVKIMKYFLK